MASELKVDKFTGVTTAGSIDVTGEGNSTTTNLQQGLAKAWLRSINDASLQDSFNIGSGTDNGTGDYSYALTNAFSNSNYSQPCSCRVGITYCRIAMFNASRQDASTLAVHTENDAGTSVDVNHVISGLGDLA